MPDTPEALMLFAAGFGTRMGALAQDRPKPLISVAGRPLIDHALDQAEAAAIKRSVVNLHYRGAQIAAYLEGRGILFSWENDVILETGGGLRAALPLLGAGPVFTLNTDAVWTGKNPLVQLRAAWNGTQMDALLLLLPATSARGTAARGDFRLSADGRISRGAGGEDQLYLGAQIIRTDLLVDFPARAFSLNRVWDLMMERGRAYGIVHQGGWCDVGTPAGIAEAEALLTDG
jgi:N-acetyl-alpha-D-muramate 1-phosphate uridylyltransferase